MQWDHPTIKQDGSYENMEEWRREAIEMYPEWPPVLDMNSPDQTKLPFQDPFFYRSMSLVNTPQMMLEKLNGTDGNLMIYIWEDGRAIVEGIEPYKYWDKHHFVHWHCWSISAVPRINLLGMCAMSQTTNGLMDKQMPRMGGLEATQPRSEGLTDPAIQEDLEL